MKTLTEFTTNDTIFGDRADYAAFSAALELALQPCGMLELVFAAEIVRAAWRLQFIPGVTDAGQFHLLAKVRAKVQTTIRWATTELRRIQTARRIREEQELPDSIGIGDAREILKARPKAARQAAAPTPEQAPPKQSARSANRPNPSNDLSFEATIAKFMVDEEAALKQFDNEHSRAA